tara:strand:+ start:36 stop:743 length:708 start_codon:yes stop_codon:yes gene_type:complete
MAKRTGTTTGRPNPHTDTGFSHATPPSTKKTHQGGNGSGGKTKTVTTSGDNKPEKYKSNIKVTGPITAGLWLADTIISPYSKEYNKKKRSEFARKEGLYREYYIGNQYNKDPKSRTLNVMSDTGKDFLKDAGYGPFQEKTKTAEGEGQRCADGTMPPCPPTGASTPVTPTSTTPTSTWQLYPEDSDYLTGKGYDTGGGVRKGPPPKRGPNPQVPPLLFSRGGGAAVRGTKFKGVK